MKYKFLILLMGSFFLTNCVWPTTGTGTVSVAARSSKQYFLDKCNAGADEYKECMSQVDVSQPLAGMSACGRAANNIKALIAEYEMTELSEDHITNSVVNCINDELQGQESIDIDCTTSAFVEGKKKSCEELAEAHNWEEEAEGAEE